jgi:hypothetical protein
MSQPQPDKVILEDLLRLKRAERPAAEFWAQFDRELQAKQLAALVGKRSWWHSAAHKFTRVTYLPLGAAAALAFAFMAVREYRSPVAEVTQSIRLPAPAPKLVPAPAVVRIAAPAQPPAVAVRQKAVSAAVATVLPADRSAAAPAAAPDVSAAITWLANAFQVTRASPMAEHSMFVTFADAHIANPRPDSSLASIGDVRTRRTADPLAQISSPSETRHARLIAALTDVHLVSTVDPVALMHQRLATRMDDDGLADDAGRLGASGNSVSFKF